MLSTPAAQHPMAARPLNETPAGCDTSPLIDCTNNDQDVPDAPLMEGSRFPIVWNLSEPVVSEASEQEIQ